MTALDNPSCREHARPPDRQLSPFLGPISSRARLGVGSGEVLWFVEQVGQ